MSRRNSFGSILVTCLLAAGSLAIASSVDTASAGQSYSKSGKHAKRNWVNAKQRRHAPRLYLPVGPSYLYYDYPYYYSRGYYPTHIGPHYIYYGFPYQYGRD
jgi:hypothetical protein